MQHRAKLRLFLLVISLRVVFFLMKYSEQHIHIGIVHHFRELARDLRTFWLFHCYNGGLRQSKRHASLLKALGVYAGVPDLIFLIKGGRVIFIEIKAKGGYLSKRQKSFIRMLENFAFPVYVVKAIDQEDGINQVRGILISNGVFLT